MASAAPALLHKGTSETHLTATLHLEKTSKDALDAETRAAAKAAQEKLERRRPSSALRRKKLAPQYARPAHPSEQSDARSAEPASTSTPPPGALAPKPPPPRKSGWNAHRSFQFRPFHLGAPAWRAALMTRGASSAHLHGMIQQEASSREQLERVHNAERDRSSAKLASRVANRRRSSQRQLGAAASALSSRSGRAMLRLGGLAGRAVGRLQRQQQQQEEEEE